MTTIFNNFRNFTQSLPSRWDLWFAFGSSRAPTLTWRPGVLAEILHGFFDPSGKLWHTALKGLRPINYLLF